MKTAYRIYRPQHPKASVFIIHGMEEHKERYVPFAQYLCDHDIGVLIYDLPGHGDIPKEDMGWFGEKDGYRNLIHSAVDAATETKKAFPDVPLFCLGHSMGSMIARNFLQKYSDLIDGMILSGAPCYQPGAAAGKALVKVIALQKGKKGHSKLLDDMSTGSFNKSVENPRTEADWLSYDTDNVDAYLADEKCGVPFTVQGYGDLFELVIRMHDSAAYRVSKPDLPIVILTGEDDPCTGGVKGVSDSLNTLVRAGYINVEAHAYPHMRHEILNETEKMTVWQDITDWIDAHI